MNQNMYETIKERILFLEYTPGFILNESTLCKEFNVSRTPLREVLNQLKNENLVRIFPRMGTMVTELEFQQMMNALQVRGEIEGLLGKLAAEEMTEKHLAALRKIQKKCANLENNKDKKKLVRLDTQFRKILYSASRNSVLENIAQSLYELTLRLWVVTMDKGTWKEEVRFISREMEALIAALAQKDPIKSAKLKKNFLSFHYDRISKKFMGQA
ncbi:transcriptional regulator, GntR family [Desulfocicer vacuolatum DSM 3385]|uniref:Transcriptional regulator, GntR family n=1 Tax=Desulfocicer vacuolatum DSM 3385 TaxID=1121400 RepID=A0A1W2CQH4_9BACT|nr:GntR family transcriptional regulator [Desulfocicer vacuolatum]SMC87226.1 transcriptional regulator, GntR family [Desulfocicer vacuolatum DSM 3385]